MLTSVDGLLDKLLGQYQVLVYFIVLSNVVHVHLNHYLLQHYLWIPSHHCKVPDEFEEDSMLPLFSDQELFNSSRIFLDSHLLREDPIYQDPFQKPSNDSLSISSANPGFSESAEIRLLNRDERLKRSVSDTHAEQKSIHLQNQTLLVSRKAFENNTINKISLQEPEDTKINHPVDTQIGSQVATFANTEINSKKEFASCEMFVKPNRPSEGTQPCVYGHVFNLKRTEWTITAEWGLVCERSWIRHWLRVSNSIGLVIGGVSFGLLSDRFGRRNLLLICVGLVGGIGLALHFVKRLLVYFILRSCQAIFSQGLHLISWTLMAELLPPKWRCRGLVVAGAAAPVGSILAAVASFHLGHWRAIQLATSLPVLASLCYSCLVPESLRWLLTRGKLIHAHREANRSARLNLLLLPPTAYTHLKSLSTNLTGEEQPPNSNPHVFNPSDLIKIPRIRRNIIIICFMWFSISVTEKVLKGDVAPFGSHGIVTRKKGEGTLFMRMENPLIEAMIVSAVDVGGVILALMLSSFFYRRSLLMLLLLSAAALTLVFVGTMRMITDMWKSIPIVWIVLKLIGVLVIAGSRTLVGVILPEICPTTSRATAIGLCWAVSGLGHIVTPLIVLWGDLTYDIIPWIACTAICLLSSLLIFLVPETAGVNLPDIAQEAALVGLRHRGDVMKSSKDPGYGRADFVLNISGPIFGQSSNEPNSNRIVDPQQRSTSLQGRYIQTAPYLDHLRNSRSESFRSNNDEITQGKLSVKIRESRPFSPSGSTSSCSAYSSSSFVGIRPNNLKNLHPKGNASGLRQSLSTLSGGDGTSTEFLSDESNTDGDVKSTNDFNHVEYQIFNRHQRKFEKIDESQEEELESENAPSTADETERHNEPSIPSAPKIVSSVPVTKQNPIRSCSLETKKTELPICVLEMRHTRQISSPHTVKKVQSNKTGNSILHRSPKTQKAKLNSLQSVSDDADSISEEESLQTSNHKKFLREVSSSVLRNNNKARSFKTTLIPVIQNQKNNNYGKTLATSFKAEKRNSTSVLKDSQSSEKSLSSISQNSKLMRLSERKQEAKGMSNFSKSSSMSEKNLPHNRTASINTSKMLNSRQNSGKPKNFSVLARQTSSIEPSKTPKIRIEAKKTRSFILPRQAGKDVALKIAQFESSNVSYPSIKIQDQHPKSKIPIRKMRSTSNASSIISEKVKQFESTNVDSSKIFFFNDKKLIDGKQTYRVRRSLRSQSLKVFAKTSNGVDNLAYKGDYVIPKSDVEVTDDEETFM